MADLGTAYVNIVPKASGIEKKIGNLLGPGSEAGGRSGGAKAGKSFIDGLKSAAITVAVGKVIKDAFSAGGDLQQSFGGLDTIYGEASTAAKQYAMDAAQAGISANTYAEQAVSFGAALKAAYGGDTTAAMEAANLAIMDMADNSAKMGTDITSVQNAYQGFARGQYQLLDNLKLGYGGTQAEMQRLLDDAQKISGVKYDMSNLGDVYSAIHVIQTELGLTGVAAEEAKTTLTGSFNALKASWENTLAALTTGEGLETALSNLSESVGNFANNILQMLGQVAPQVPIFVMGIVDALIANAPSLIAGGVEMIAQLIVGLVQSIPQVVDQIPVLWEAVKSAFSGVDWASLGTELINGIVAGITAAASFLWETMKSLASSALSAAKEALGIASPSKLFSDEVGRWIPPGIAAGVEKNVSPLNNTMAKLSTSITGDMATATATTNSTGAAQNMRTNADDQREIVNNVTIRFEGSLAQLARVLHPYIVTESDRRGPLLIK